MAILRARKALSIAAGTAAAAFLGATALTSAHAAPRAAASPSPAAAAGELGYAVEDFNYPGADQLLEDRGITLKRGDGHITLTGITDVNECRADASNIAVESWLGTFCFHSNAKSGHLTMELADTFNLWTGDQAVKATLTAEGKETVVDAPANKLTPVGQSGDTGKRSALVEIRVNG